MGKTHFKTKIYPVVACGRRRIYTIYPHITGPHQRHGGGRGGGQERAKCATRDAC